MRKLTKALARTVEVSRAVLSDLHEEAIYAASGIAPEVALARGYVTVEKASDLAELGFAVYQAVVPGLLVPIHGVDGGIVTYQFRPDVSRIAKGGRAIKYETLAGHSNRIDVPPCVQPMLNDPAVPLWITEGSKKADSAASRGLCCVALMGVWGFVGTNDFGGKTELSDWRNIALNGRTVYIAFDSDVMTNASVYGALVELAKMLVRKKAKPRFVLIPAGDGEKVGLDDWFSLGGTSDDLIANASDSLPGCDPDSEEVERLAGLPPLQRDREYKASAKRMSVSVSTLRKLVESAVKGNRKDETLQGSAIHFDAVEPWSEPVNGADVLSAISNEISRYMVLPSYAAQSLALWVAHTYAYDCFQWTPKIGIISPEKQCGKSSLIAILMPLVPKALATDSISTAALFRVISEHHPTLFMDEADGYPKDKDDLRQMLNSSSQRSKSVIRCVGDDFAARSFDVFGPICYGMIGEPWDTVADRSIMIRLKRKPKAVKVERFKLRDAEEELVNLARKVCRFVLEIQPGLASARPVEPEGLDDRAFDIWEPLLAIADAAGGTWPSVAREAAICLSGVKEKIQQTKGLKLLADIREVFTCDRLSSVALCELLCGIEESVWAECRKGDKPINPVYLAQLLKPYDVVPTTVRIGSSTPKGYLLSCFDDPFSRYLPDLAATAQQTAGLTSGGTSCASVKPVESTYIVADIPQVPFSGEQDRNIKVNNSKHHGTTGNVGTTEVAVLREYDVVEPETEYY